MHNHNKTLGVGLVVWFFWNQGQNNEKDCAIGNLLNTFVQFWTLEFLLINKQTKLSSEYSYELEWMKEFIVQLNFFLKIICRLLGREIKDKNSQ